MRLGCSTNLGVGNSTVLEQDHRRNPAHAVFRRGIGMVVDVELHNRDIVTQLFANFFKARADHLARAAPFRPKIDEDRFAGLQNLGVKIAVAYGSGCHQKSPLTCN